MNNDKPLVIYHGNCADGFGAAWCFHHSNPKGYNFHAGVYQNPPPEISKGIIFLVDFSYKHEVVEELLMKGNRIILLDHHKTAIDDLQYLIDGGHINAICDVNRSGAMIAWDYLFNRNYLIKPAPKLIEHIEDRDLWRFALPYTREIQANVFSYPYEFPVWDELMNRDVNELIAEGKAIERKHHKDVAELLGVTTRMLTIGGYTVPVANVPYTLTSDAGHELCKAYGSPFAACYWDTPAGRVFSLRSLDDGLDVSEIAKKYGGGGHPHASGFKIPFTELPDYMR